MDTPNSDNNNTPLNNNERDENGDLTPESLQAQLAAYRRALETEFQMAESVADTTAQEEATIEFFRKNVPVAAAQIVHQMQFASSDAVRLNAAKYLLDRVFKHEAETGDPVNELLKKLKSNKPNPMQKGEVSSRE